MKTTTVRRSIGIAAAALACLVGELASGAPYSESGTVYFLASQYSAYPPDADYFLLNGVTAAGTCPKLGGFVVFRLRDDAKGQRQFSMVLSAKIAQTSISVNVDDANVDSAGFCWAMVVGS